MEKNIKIQSQFLNSLNEALQKIALSDKVSIVKQPYMEADGNFTSILKTSEPFDMNKLGNSITASDMDEEKAEKKAELVAQATDKIEKTVQNNDELHDILAKIRKINDENGSNEWKVNEENNTATLFNKNARIFRQNNKLCLSYNDKIELFDSVAELHKFLEDHNLPLPKNIEIHESVDLKEYYKKDFKGFSDAWNNILLKKNHDVQSQEDKNKRKNLEKELDSIKNDERYEREHLMDYELKIKDIERKLRELENKQSIATSQETSKKNSESKDKFNKLINKLPKASKAKRDDKSEGFFKSAALRKAFMDYGVTKKGQSIQSEIDELERIIRKHPEAEAKFGEKLQSLKDELARKKPLGTETTYVDLQKALIDAKNALEKEKDPETRKAYAAQLQAELDKIPDSVIEEINWGDKDEWTKEQADARWDAQLRKPRLLRGKEYTMAYNSLDKEDQPKIFKKDPVKAKKDVNAAKDKLSDMEDKLEKLKQKFNVKKESTMEENNQIDNVWYLQYANPNSDSVFYLNSEWENGNLLTDNQQEAAAFLTPEAAGMELNMVKLTKKPEFDFTPVPENGMEECGIGGATTASLGPAVQYTASKKENIKEDEVNPYAYTADDKKLLKANRLDAEGHFPSYKTRGDRDITLSGRRASIYNLANKIKDPNASDDEVRAHTDQALAQNRKDTFSNNWSMQWLAGKDAFRATKESPEVQELVAKLTPWLGIWAFDKTAAGKVWKLATSPEQLNELIVKYNEMYATPDGEGYKQALKYNPNIKPSPAIALIPQETIDMVNQKSKEEQLYQKFNKAESVEEIEEKLTPQNGKYYSDYTLAVMDCFNDYILGAKDAIVWWRENIYPIIYGYKNKSLRSREQIIRKSSEGELARRDTIRQQDQELANEDSVKKVLDGIITKANAAFDKGKNATPVVINALYAAEEKLNDKDKFNALLRLILAKGEAGEIDLDSRGINQINAMKLESYQAKLGKVFYESMMLKEEDSPADFATGSPIDGAATPDAGIDPSAAQEAPTADAGAQSAGMDMGSAPAPQGMPDFGDVNVNVAGQEEYGPEGDEQQPALPPQEQYRIVDILANNDNKDNIKVKLQNVETGETEIKSLNEIDV